eukprot:SAG11_NODE_10763_length_807_cov_1.063559_2_plen_154_part_01
MSSSRLLLFPSAVGLLALLLFSAPLPSLALHGTVVPLHCFYGVDVQRTLRLLSVKLLGAIADGSHDDSDAVQRAIQCAAIAGGVIWFPPGQYVFNTTVNLFEDPAPNYGNQTWAGKYVVLQGSNSPQGGGSVAGMIPPQTVIRGPASGPAIRIG